jgi:hypothetical protein
MNSKLVFQRYIKLSIGFICLMFLNIIPGSGGIVIAQEMSIPGLTLTVTNLSEAINGDVTSPAALLANPGTDGISLIEALTAVEADTGTHETINFDPSLSGSVIQLTQYLPSIDRDGLTLDGDIDDDGIPDITLKGSSLVTSALQIHASDVVIEGLHISDFPSNGIEIRTTPERGFHLVKNLVLRHNILTNLNSSTIIIRNDLDHAVIRNIEISDNTFQNYPVGITISAGSANGASDNEISNISILSNTLTTNRYAIGIFISPTGMEGISRNTVKDIQIIGNTISKHAIASILVDAANQADCNDNITRDILISENQIDGTPVTIEMVSVGGSGTDSEGNMLSNVTITDNILTGGGIQFGGANGYNSHDNAISGVLIERNHISSCAANGISFYAGAGGSHDNLLENVILRNTLIDNCRNGAGILLHGDDSTSQRDIINNIAIANLTLVNNGIESLWGGGLNINTLDSSNAITGVTVSSTILWQNGGEDAILGSLVPNSVSYSRLNDRRFLGSNDNFNLDPKFINPDSGNYNLQPGSPCVDSGDSSGENVGTLDLEKKSRLWDGDGDGSAVVDRGAFESNVTLAPEIEVQSDNPEPQTRMIYLAFGVVLIIGLWLWKRRGSNPK